MIEFVGLVDNSLTHSLTHSNNAPSLFPPLFQLKGGSHLVAATGARLVEVAPSTAPKMRVAFAR